MTLHDYLRAAYMCDPPIGTKKVGESNPARTAIEETPSPLADRAGAGPTRIKIAAGAVTADDTRVGLLGTWEPDADLGLPPGANHVIYLADGVYINPFRNVALIGFWRATADSLTMTPTEVRNIETTLLVPELKDMFSQIAWNKPGTSKITWLTPERYQEAGQREARRKTARVHEIDSLHAAIVVNLLAGSWTGVRGIFAFAQDGAYRELITGDVLAPAQLSAAKLRVMLTGRYSVDGGTGALRRSIEAVESIGQEVTAADRDRILAIGRNTGVLRIGARASSTLRWLGRDELTMDGERWLRREKT
jgi:hypothetical protein